MEFKNRYCSTSDKDKPENKEKKALSDDAFAIGEMLDEIRIQMFRAARHG